jgi:pimeloyl-ACP methyl ester carboxylesterase
MTAKRPMAINTHPPILNSFPPFFGVRRELKIPPLERIDFAAVDGTALCMYHPKRDALHLKGEGRCPVILTPGTAMSALSYCIDTVKCNFVEFLVEQGFDVWLFDWRTSPLLAAHEQSYTVDDVARCDWPAAVEKVRSLTGQEQVAVMAHCLSSPCFMLSLVRGYTDCKHVSALVASQVGLHLELTPFGRLKVHTRLDRLLPTGEVIHEKQSQVNFQLSDAVISGLSIFIPKAYGCYNAACYRQSATFGDIILHSRLNPKTHAIMGELLPECSTGFLKDVAFWLRKNCVLKKEDFAHLDRLQLPITFISGSENRMFVPEGTARTYELLREKNGPENYERKVYPGFGHLDCFISDAGRTKMWPDITKALGNGDRQKRCRTPSRLRTLGLAFRERMSGTLVWGEPDPEAAARRPERPDNTVSIVWVITILDLKAFLRSREEKKSADTSPKHSSRLRSALDYAGHVHSWIEPGSEAVTVKPFRFTYRGETVLGHNDGVFKPFVQDKVDPKLKLIIYETCLEQNGKEYYLIGEKRLTKGSIANLCKETTTLWVKLHEGKNETGQIVASGCLTQKPLDLMRLLFSMHAINATRANEKIEAPVKYIRFFLDGLWNIYRNSNAIKATRVIKNIGAAVKYIAYFLLGLFLSEFWNTHRRRP